jgi:hypothetical protein
MRLRTNGAVAATRSLVEIDLGRESNRAAVAGAVISLFGHGMSFTLCFKVVRALPYKLLSFRVGLARLPGEVGGGALAFPTSPTPPRLQSSQGKTPPVKLSRDFYTSLIRALNPRSS